MKFPISVAMAMTLLVTVHVGLKHNPHTW